MINIVCEVYGLIGNGNCASIGEIECYNKDNKINYSTTSEDCYDYAKGTPSTWWNSFIWDRTKLNNGSASYTSTNNGSTNCVVFFYSQSQPAVKTCWARFLLNLDIDDISSLSKIVTYVGDPDQRTPITIKYYYAKNYDKTRHLNHRDNSDLILLGELNFSSLVTTPTPFDINLKWNKYLIKQGDNYYSIQNSALTQLGTPTDDTQKKQWFNDYGVDDLKGALLTPDENGNKLIDSLNSQFEIRMMKAK